MSKEYKKLERLAVKVFVEYAIEASKKDGKTNKLGKKHLEAFADVIVEERQERELGRELDLNTKEEDVYYDGFNEAQDTAEKLVERVISIIENKDATRIAELILQSDKLMKGDKNEK